MHTNSYHIQILSKIMFENKNNIFIVKARTNVQFETAYLYIIFVKLYQCDIISDFLYRLLEQGYFVVKSG